MRKPKGWSEMNADQKIAALKEDLDDLSDIVARNEERRKASEDRLEELIKRLVFDIGVLRVNSAGKA